MVIFFILDCCHTAEAFTSNSTTMQVLAVCTSHALKNLRVGNISFTQRIARAIRSLAHSGKPSTSTDEIFNAVQNETLIVYNRETQVVSLFIANGEATQVMAWDQLIRGCVCSHDMGSICSTTVNYRCGVTFFNH
ncbi:uncharacterized protein N7500_009160 [Penicillium coprophilum]|uniref:uncharacterized protein n=1 Tax=Penicillium coprophilum TaxID=36646 RepID=UPI0023865E4C|nr:uncharacterized protein N7500_009160 [Penicillium coprophilum]KAJ5153721.1 hypothetical protein N7500_009160 [Penicillium coprophilum]